MTVGLRLPAMLKGVGDTCFWGSVGGARLSKMVLSSSHCPAMWGVYFLREGEWRDVVSIK